MHTASARTGSRRGGLRWYERRWQPAELFLAHGTDGHDAWTRRRLRRANGIALFLAATALVLAVVFSLILVAAGQTPFTIGNAGFLMVCVLLAPVPLLHRFGDLAAPLYIIAVPAALLMIVHSAMGYAQGMHNAFILLAISVPLLIGPDRRVLGLAVASVLIVLFIGTEFWFPEIGPAIAERPRYIVETLRYLSLLTVIVLVFLVVKRAVDVAEGAERALAVEHDRAQMLLHNIMPDAIADRLKRDPGAVIAERHEDASVLFADIVDFTPRSGRRSAREVVGFLNCIFREFDALVAERGLEKIKTIGDAYMVVGGVPRRRRDDTERLADLALAMVDACRELSRELGEEVEIRVGLHAGEVVAGVIGTAKFAYDVWGDTVNVAARMQTHGEPGRIQVSQAVRDTLADRFVFSRRRTVDMKGMGPQPVYFLLARSLERPGLARLGPRS